MRILVISDIHANLTALDAVLNEAGEVDAVWCLGDIVGYGPDPNECVERVRSLPGLVCVLGNHDAAALRQIDPEGFNPEARTAIYWTQRALSEASLRFLRSLPEVEELEMVTLLHGSPRHPVWEYLLDARTATLNFRYFHTPFCFVGHTHLPVIYSLPPAASSARLTIPEPNSVEKIEPRAIINPGSVGQPRDRDPRAAYAIFDPDTLSWSYKRVAYEVAEVQGRMAAVGLPERHIYRLASGW